MPTPFCPHIKMLGEGFEDIVSRASSQETGYIVLGIGVGDPNRMRKVGFFGNMVIEFDAGSNRFSAKGHISQIFSIPEYKDLRMIVECSDAAFFHLSPFMTGNE